MIAQNPSEADFHGPYNKLLCTLFPGNTDFTVFPRYEQGSFESPNPRYLFDVLHDDRLAFMLEYKAPRYYQFGSERDDADLKLRQRMEDLRSECPLPVLHGVSAFGTRLCFYKMEHNQPIHPPFIRDPESLTLRVTGTAPRKRWDCDILNENGEKRFKSMVEEIKQAFATL